MIKLFEQFNEYSQVKFLLDDMGIVNYIINDDLTVDVNGDVLLPISIIREIPIQFGEVYGNFDCSNNQLTSLMGSPNKVGGNFDCSNNQLTSLMGCPKEVGGGFYCGNNQITSLNDCPKEVIGVFYCGHNELTSLMGSPNKVGGGFYCSSNKLTSLMGCPKEVGGEFSCYDNKLTSLMGCPKEVGGEFSYYDNKLPNVISDLSIYILKILIKYQEEYGIWNSDGSLNKKRWDIFQQDLNNNIIDTE